MALNPSGLTSPTGVEGPSTNAGARRNVPDVPVQTEILSEADCNASSQVIIPAETGVTCALQYAWVQAQAAVNVTLRSRAYALYAYYVLNQVALALTSYWRLNDAAAPAADSGGLDVDLNAVGGPTFNQTGIRAAVSLDNSTCVLFDGVNDALEAADPTPYSYTDEMSLVVWFKTTGVGAIGTNRLLVGKSDHAITPGVAAYMLQIPAGQTGLSWNLLLSDNSFLIVENLAVNVADGALHCAAVTYDRNNIAEVYIDDVLVASAVPGDLAIAQGTANFTLGMTDDDLRPFDGYLQDLSAHGARLSAAQVSALYARGTTASYNLANVTPALPIGGAPAVLDLGENLATRLVGLPDGNIEATADNAALVSAVVTVRRSLRP